MLHVQPDQNDACLRPEPSQARRDWTWTLLQPQGTGAPTTARATCLLLRTGSKVSLAASCVSTVTGSPQNIRTTDIQSIGDTACVRFQRSAQMSENGMGL